MKHQDAYFLDFVGVIFKKGFEFYAVIDQFEALWVVHRMCFGMVVTEPVTFEIARIDMMKNRLFDTSATSDS